MGQDWVDKSPSELLWSKQVGAGMGGSVVKTCKLAGTAGYTGEPDDLKKKENIKLVEHGYERS